jgi:hypothetical protein
MLRQIVWLLHSLPLTHSRISMEISTSLSLPLSGEICNHARCCVICGIKVATTSCPLPLSALEMHVHACTILDKPILWQATTSIVVLCVIAAKCKNNHTADIYYTNYVSH